MLTVSPDSLSEGLQDQVEVVAYSPAKEMPLLDDEKMNEAVYGEMWEDYFVWSGVLMLLMKMKLTNTNNNNANNASGDFVWTNHEGRKFVLFPLQLHKDPAKDQNESKTKELVSYMQTHNIELGIGIFCIGLHFGFFQVDLSSGDDKVVIQVKHSRGWGKNKRSEFKPTFLNSSLKKWMADVLNRKVVMEYDEYGCVGEDHTTGVHHDQFELVCGPAVVAETYKFIHGEFPAAWTSIDPEYVPHANRRRATTTSYVVTYMSKNDKKVLLQFLVRTQLELIAAGALLKDDADTQAVFNEKIQDMTANWQTWGVWGGDNAPVGNNNNNELSAEPQANANDNNSVVAVQEQEQGDDTNNNERPAEQKQAAAADDDDDDVVVIVEQQQPGQDTSSNHNHPSDPKQETDDDDVVIVEQPSQKGANKRPRQEQEADNDDHDDIVEVVEQQQQGGCKKQKVIEVN